MHRGGTHELGVIMVVVVIDTGSSEMQASVPGGSNKLGE